MSVEIEQVGTVDRGRATARTHTVFVDRPVEKGGTDRGPLGGESTCSYHWEVVS